ncbi:DUF3309 family protein [Methylobacter tundripaludum]
MVSGLKRDRNHSRHSSRRWGYGPSGGLGLVLIILLDRI